MPESAKAVFLSYASQDADAARRIAETLRTAGIEVWFDQSELRGGDAWDHKIRQQIKECALFLPIISANTQARLEGYFRREWRLAVDRMHDMDDAMPFLVPVVIDDTTDAAARVPERFKERQWMRLPGGVPSPSFSADLAKLLAGEHAPTPSTTNLSHGTIHGRAQHRPARSSRRWLVAAVGVLVLAVGTLRWSPLRSFLFGEGSAASPAQDLVAKAAELNDRVPDATRNDLLQAAELARQATNRDPQRADAWAVSALVNANLYANFDHTPARFEQARADAQYAINLAPDSTGAKFAQATVLAQQEPTRAEGIRKLRELLEAVPDDHRVLCTLGLALLADGKSDEAVTIFERADALPGGDAKALVYKVNAVWAKSNWAEAKTAVDRSYALHPGPAALLFKIWIAWYYDGDLDEAARLADQIPGPFLLEDSGARTAALVWLDHREPEKVIKVLRAFPRDFLTDKYETEPKAYLLGEAEALAGHTDAARLEWQAALTVVERRLTDEPNVPQLIYRKAVLLARLGDQAEAPRWVAIYEQLQKPGPSMQARLDLIRGDREQAINHLNEAFHAPALQSTRGFLCELQTSHDFTPLLAEPRYQQLIQDVQAAITPDPRIPANALPGSPSDKSVAVLAFANLSDDKGNEYFSDGVSEELIDLLGRVPGLTVKGRTSAFLFKGKNTSSAEIARQLGVNYLVRGSVQKAGDKVRITAQLTRAQTDEVIWSSPPLVRELTDIWSVQEEIAGLVASNLSLALGATPQGGEIRDPEAYRLYLEGRHDWSLRSLDGFERAEQALTRAVAIEPDSALLHAALADVYVMRSWYRVDFGLPPGDGFARAQPEADRAVALGPDLAQVYEAPAALAFSQRKWDEAERLIRKSLELAPNDAVAYNRLGDVMVERGRLDLALENYQRAVQLDPLSPYMVRDVVRVLYRARRFQEVIDAVARYEAVVPDDVRRHVWRAGAWMGLGKKVEAARELKAILPGLLVDENPLTYSSEAVLLLRQAGCETEAATLADELARRCPAGSYLQPLLLLARGEIDQALPALQPLPPSTGDDLFWGVRFDGVRDDPRFLAWVAQLPCAAEYKVARANLAEMLRQQKTGP